MSIDALNVFERITVDGHGGVPFSSVARDAIGIAKAVKPIVILRFNDSELLVEKTATVESLWELYKYVRETAGSRILEKQLW